MKTYKAAAVAAILAFAFWGCGDRNKKFDAMGVFESDEVLVSSEEGGKILYLDIREGDRLEKGRIIGQIDTKELELNKEQLVKKIASAQAKKSDIKKQLAPLEEQLKTARTEQARTMRLLKADAATQKNLDDINAQIALLQRQLEAQKSSMDLANKSIEDEIQSMDFQIGVIDYKIGRSSVSSPINGTVLEKYAYAGEVASPNKPLFKVADTDVLRLKAYVIEPQLTHVKLGDKATVFVDFGEKYRQYGGTVSWISDQAEFTPKTIMTKDERENLVYAVKIDVKNDGYLKIGSYGEVKFQNGTADNGGKTPGIVK